LSRRLKVFDQPVAVVQTGLTQKIGDIDPEIGVSQPPQKSVKALSVVRVFGTKGDVN
jgi:hypothetical protein